MRFLFPVHIKTRTLAIYPAVIVHWIIYEMLSQVYVVERSLLIMCSALAGTSLVALLTGYVMCFSHLQTLHLPPSTWVSTQHHLSLLSGTGQLQKGTLHAAELCWMITVCRSLCFYGSNLTFQIPFPFGANVFDPHSDGSVVLQF